MQTVAAVNPVNRLIQEFEKKKKLEDEEETGLKAIAYDRT